MDSGDFPRAARGFAAQLRTSSRSSYSVQLLVACSEETIAKAARAVSAKELFIVAAEYRGRSCYRVCWGVYESEATARSAAAAIPEYFRKGGASPKPVSTASILP
jgi:septal ring-binding cell division protein DamX